MKHENPFTEFFNIIAKDGFSLKGNDISPNLAISLATQGSVRIVYLKKFIDGQFYFFTNLESRKAREIKENPYVSLCIFLEKPFLQIRLEGKAQQGEREIAEEYFKTRPKLSQAGAILSHQSAPLENYEEFIKKAQELSKEEALKCPHHWGCFKIVPESFEFWEGTEFRLHLRTIYKKQGENWKQSILYP
jgi:pyridoxamine 5'-phosphate oxidase